MDGIDGAMEKIRRLYLELAAVEIEEKSHQTELIELQKVYMEQYETLTSEERCAKKKKIDEKRRVGMEYWTQKRKLNDEINTFEAPILEKMATLGGDQLSGSGFAWEKAGDSAAMPPVSKMTKEPASGEKQLTGSSGTSSSASNVVLHIKKNKTVDTMTESSIVAPKKSSLTNETLALEGKKEGVQFAGFHGLSGAALHIKEQVEKDIAAQARRAAKAARNQEKQRQSQSTSSDTNNVGQSASTPKELVPATASLPGGQKRVKGFSIADILGIQGENEGVVEASESLPTKPSHPQPASMPSSSNTFFNMKTAQELGNKQMARGSKTFLLKSQKSSTPTPSNVLLEIKEETMEDPQIEDILVKMEEIKEEIDDDGDVSESPAKKPRKPRQSKSTSMPTTRKRKNAKQQNEVVPSQKRASKAKSTVQQKAVVVKPHCICNDNRDVEIMVSCDNKDCQTEWFHFDCVGIFGDAPAGDWFCSNQCHEEWRANGGLTKEELEQRKKKQTKDKNYVYNDN